MVAVVGDDLEGAARRGVRVAERGDGGGRRLGEQREGERVAVGLAAPARGGGQLSSSAATTAAGAWHAAAKWSGALPCASRSAAAAGQRSSSSATVSIDCWHAHAVCSSVCLPRRARTPSGWRSSSARTTSAAHPFATAPTTGRLPSASHTAAAAGCAASSASTTLSGAPLQHAKCSAVLPVAPSTSFASAGDAFTALMSSAEDNGRPSKKAKSDLLAMWAVEATASGEISERGDATATRTSSRRRDPRGSRTHGLARTQKSHRAQRNSRPCTLQAEMAEDTSRWSKANAPWQKSSGGGGSSGGGKGGDGGWENDTKMQHAAAAAIRDALTENARGGRDDDVDAGIVSVGEASIRHTEVSDVGGGGSRLGKRDLGSSAMQAALTLHPCVHVGGVNDAAKSTLHTMFAMAGPCSVSLVVDDDGEPTGEASVTYESAAAAAAAIQMYDGSPFDDGVLVVSASKNAAQGSLTKRGRGRHNMTLHEKTQIRASAALQERPRPRKTRSPRRARERARRPPSPPPPPPPPRARRHSAARAARSARRRRRRRCRAS